MVPVGTGVCMCRTNRDDFSAPFPAGLGQSIGGRTVAGRNCLRFGRENIGLFRFVRRLAWMVVLGGNLLAGEAQAETEGPELRIDRTDGGFRVGWVVSEGREGAFQLVGAENLHDLSDGEAAVMEGRPAPATVQPTNGTPGTVLMEQIVPDPGRQSHFMKLESAPAPGDYVIIDLAPGPDATNYPVSYLPALPTPVSDDYRKTKLALRRMPAGTLAMGSPQGEPGRFAYERQHEVSLTQDFYIGIYEVTQDQWQRVMGSNPSAFTADNAPDASYGGLDGERPVETVSYDDIRGSSAGSGWPAGNDVDGDSFLGRLRARTELVLDLPTEAQWEYSCRAGTATGLSNGTELTDPTGHDMSLDALGWFGDNASEDFWSDPHAEKEGTQPVGRKTPNAWGLYDMLGNVMETCLDWWVDNHAAIPVTDPVGAASGTLRVLRGGDWYSSARRCRSAYRTGSLPDYRDSVQGLRLACLPRTTP